MSTGYVFVYEKDHSIKKVWPFKILLNFFSEKMLLIAVLFVLET